MCGQVSANRHIRYKYDAIDFYQEDIHWFSFSFIIICMNAFVAYSGTMQNFEDQIEQDVKEKASKTNLKMCLIFVCVRIVMLTFTFRIRKRENLDQFRSVVPQDEDSDNAVSEDKEGSQDKPSAWRV